MCAQRIVALKCQLTLADCPWDLYTPGKEPGLGRDGTEPGERSCTPVTNTQIGKAAKGSTDQNRGDRGSLTIYVSQEARSLSLECERVQSPGRHEDIAGACGKGRDQDDLKESTASGLELPNLRHCFRVSFLIVFFTTYMI